MKKELNIVYYKIENINLAKYNPRSIEDKAKKGLSESLNKFSLLQPLIINIRDKTNVLVSGHKRLEKLLEDGYTEFPMVEVDLNVDDEKILNYTMNNPKITGHFNSSVDDVLRSLPPDLDDILKSLNIDFNPEAPINNYQLNVPILPFMEVNEDNTAWESDISKVEKVKENLDGIPFKIVITGKAEDKDAVLFYLKDKLMETAFEGIHIE